MTATATMHRSGAGVVTPTTIRVLPAPRSEPPCDDELAPLGLDAPSLEAPLLPLDLPTGAQVRRQRPRPGERAERAGAPPSVQPGGGAATGSPVAVPAADAPTRVATRRFVSICVEVIGGFRPVAQLRPFCSPDAFELIAQRLLGRAVAARGGAGWRPNPAGRAPAGPPRTARGHQSAPPDRVSVLRVQACEVSDEVAEVAAVLCRRETVWAMALRLELVRGRWLCTHLELV